MSHLATKLAQARAERTADAAKDRAAVLRRLRSDRGRELAFIEASLVSDLGDRWRGLAANVLHELERDGEAHERDDGWHKGPGPSRARPAPAPAPAQPTLREQILEAAGDWRYRNELAGRVTGVPLARVLVEIERLEEEGELVSEARGLRVRRRDPGEKSAEPVATAAVEPEQREERTGERSARGAPDLAAESDGETASADRTETSAAVAPPEGGLPGPPEVREDSEPRSSAAAGVVTGGGSETAASPSLSGPEVRAWRERHGLTQKGLARGIRPHGLQHRSIASIAASLSQYESGRSTSGSKLRDAIDAYVSRAEGEPLIPQPSAGAVDLVEPPSGGPVLADPAAEEVSDHALTQHEVPAPAGCVSQPAGEATVVGDVRPPSDTPSSPPGPDGPSRTPDQDGGDSTPSLVEPARGGEPGVSLGGDTPALGVGFDAPPAHYDGGEGLEAIDVLWLGLRTQAVEWQGLILRAALSGPSALGDLLFAAFCVGNAQKYRLRDGKKTAGDADKADWYEQMARRAQGRGPDPRTHRPGWSRHLDAPVPVLRGLSDDDLAALRALLES